MHLFLHCNAAIFHWNNSFVFFNSIGCVFLPWSSSCLFAFMKAFVKTRISIFWINEKFFLSLDEFGGTHFYFGFFNCPYKSYFLQNFHIRPKIWNFPLYASFICWIFLSVYAQEKKKLDVITANKTKYV